MTKLFFVDILASHYIRNSYVIRISPGMHTHTPLVKRLQIFVFFFYSSNRIPSGSYNSAGKEEKKINRDIIFRFEIIRILQRRNLLTNIP